ncbi:MAG: HAMP domain-containing protein [Deltaproteobacteria bacterium]|nr:HAMP domain-containing protein [Deltaproteobacteria bacterium]
MRATDWKRRVLSIPIHFKILGIGSLVAALFGAVVVLVVHSYVRSTLEHTLDEQSKVVARWLASRVEQPLITGDRLALHDILRETWDQVPHISYLLVRDAAGRVVGRHSPDMEPPAWIGSDEMGERRVVREADGARVFEAEVPVLKGYAGRVRVGFDNRIVSKKLDAIDRMLLLALAICVIVGQGLALGLTYLLTRPIHQLVAAAQAVEAGDLNISTTEFFDDEIGKLSRAFNQMVGSLREQQELIEQKEEERQQLLRQVISSQEEERARIARELHDELGQSMSAMLLQLRTDKQDRPECIVHRRGMEESISQIIEQVRSMAWRLRPSILDDYGLRSALQRLVDEVSDLGKCRFDFTFVSSKELSERLDPAIEVIMYRVAQEAITNVIRHSGASRASVLLYHRPESVTLLVEDEGAGFVADADIDDKERLGLIGMRERVSLMGGEFIIETAPGRGTMVRAALPLGG